MTKLDKRLDRLQRRPPPTDLRWDEFVTILGALGFVLYEQSGGSSHKYFVREMDGEDRVIDTYRPHPGGIMKQWQLRAVCARLEEWGLL